MRQKIKTSKQSTSLPSHQLSANKMFIIEELSLRKKQAGTKYLNVQSSGSQSASVFSLKNQQNYDTTVQSSKKAMASPTLKRRNGQLLKNTIIKKTKQTPELRLKLTDYRVMNLRNQFISKLWRNCTNRPPVEYQPFIFEKHPQNHFRNGVILNQALHYFINAVTIIQILAILLIATLAVSFSHQIQNSQNFKNFLLFNIVQTLAEILYGFFIVKQNQSKQIKLRSVAKTYFSTKFWLDLLVLSVYVFNALSWVPHSSFSCLILLIKIPQGLNKVKRFELLIASSHVGHYFKLTKLVLCNFLFAHAIAIIFLLMANLNSESNWLIKFNISRLQWTQQYIWALYWSMTTMVSVGFGDITVANSSEALMLVVVQGCGCIILAYNITYAIRLITELQEKALEKNKSLSLLRQIKVKGELTDDLYSQIACYIQQSHHIQKKFNMDAVTNLLGKLPVNLKTAFLHSTNQQTIKSLQFFASLTKKSILAIAEKIQIKMTHPEQIILSPQQINSYVLILKEGEIGLFPNSFMKADALNPIIKTAIDKIIVKQGASAKLISLNFLRPFEKIKNYELRPTKYSLVCQIPLTQLLQILKDKSIDIEQYFYMRDKDSTNMNQFELFPCTICQSLRKQKQNVQSKSEIKNDLETDWHSKFDCHRLHFAPIKQSVIFRNLHKIKTQKTPRREVRLVANKKQLKLSTLKYSREIKKNRPEDSFNIYSRQYNECKSNINSDESILDQRIHESMQFLQEFDNLPNLILDPNPNRECESDMFGQSSNNIISSNKSLYRRNTCYKNMSPWDIKHGYNSALPNFWDTEADVGYDYKYYFPATNPSKLHLPK